MSAEEMLPLDTARARLADVLEELGAVGLHLREAMECAEGGNVPGAILSAEEATDAVDSAFRELEKIRDLAGRWMVWAEGRAETSNIERPTSNIEVDEEGKEPA